MINQLRIYTVLRANRGPFLERFRDHAARLMTERHGFRIQAMWTADDGETLRFVYLLAWQDADEMRARWEAFMADPDWSRIKAETGAVHGTFVDGIDEMVLEAVPFSAPIRGTP